MNKFLFKLAGKCGNGDTEWLIVVNGVPKGYDFETKGLGVGVKTKSDAFKITAYEPFTKNPPNSGFMDLAMFRSMFQ